MRSSEQSTPRSTEDGAPMYNVDVKEREREKWTSDFNEHVREFFFWKRDNDRLTD
jgi:hypothetical protein